MKSLQAGTLTEAEVLSLVTKIKTQHVRDVLDPKYRLKETGNKQEMLYLKGPASFGTRGQTTCSSDESGFTLLFVDGDLDVAGSLIINDDPEAFLIVTGNLSVEGSLITAGFVEVQGKTDIRGALAGDYNHGAAWLYGDATVGTFLGAGDYEICFGGQQHFGATVTAEKSRSQIIKKIRAAEPWSVPKPKKEKNLEAELATTEAAAFVPYSPGMRFEKGALVIHPEHGRGLVTKVISTMYVEIQFGSEKRKFAHKGW